MPPFLQGLAIGFSIAAPVGPIGVLCIRRSMTDGRLTGFVSGLGAATADALYGLVAAGGLTALTRGLLAYRSWLQCGGGIFLLYLGIATLRSKPAIHAATAGSDPNRAGAYASTFVLTLTNPMTILSFLGIFAGLGVTPDLGHAAWLVLGVAAGSTAWWLLLSTVAGWLSSHLRPGGLRWLNLASGLVIGGFGAWQIALLLRSLR